MRQAKKLDLSGMHCLNATGWLVHIMHFYVLELLYQLWDKRLPSHNITDWPYIMNE